MTKIELYSDLHLEFNKDLKLKLQEDTNVVVLAGDVVVGKSTKFIEDLCKDNPDKDIIWIAGNHEYYGQDIYETKGYYKKLSDSIHNLHFLDNSSVKIGDVVYHGTTLWTGFLSKGEAWRSIAKLEAQRNVSDFYSIKLSGSRLSADAMEGLHKESLRWLHKSLENNSGGKNVVVTHFPPLLECKHPKIESNILDAYFNNNLDDLPYEKISAWLYGHNHWSDKFNLYGCLFWSNQLGYPREVTGFDKEDWLEV